MGKYCGRIHPKPFKNGKFFTFIDDEPINFIVDKKYQRFRIGAGVYARDIKSALMFLEKLLIDYKDGKINISFDDPLEAELYFLKQAFNDFYRKV